MVYALYVFVFFFFMDHEALYMSQDFKSNMYIWFSQFVRKMSNAMVYVSFQ